MATHFIPRRQDFDHRNQPITADVPNRYCHLLAAVIRHVGLANRPQLRGSGPDAAVLFHVFWLANALVPARLQREDIRPEPRRVLFRQCVMVGWQNATVQGTRQLLDPSMVEMMKNARINAGPVVSWHNLPSTTR
jgi:hypothetical protein